MPTRRDFLKTVGLGAAAVATASLHRNALAEALAGGQPDGPPNVILILADDLGYGDIGSYGCKDIKTPHIDALAADGVRFTNAYVASPICGPSRAGLITGRYPNRFGFELNWDNILPCYEPSMAEMFRGAGYDTGIIGKWHLGHTSDTHPLARGFDEFYGDIGGIFNYLPTPKKPEVVMWRGNRDLYDRNEGLTFRDRYMRGYREEKCPIYTTDQFNREACDFVRRHQEKPFFLFLSHHAPHIPLMATKEHLDRYRRDDFAAWGDQAEARHTYAAMVSAMDDGVGAIRKTLEDLKLDRRTLILFLNDNGATRDGLNDPLAGGKKTLWEGGIRTPMIAFWPGRTPKGRTSDAVVSALDLYPTLTALADGKLHGERKPDGVDARLALVDGKGTLPARDLFWRCSTQRAMRRGRWKILGIDDEPLRLFDLEADPGEENDLAASQPQRVKELAAAYDAWELMMAPPAWGPKAELQKFEAHLRRRRGAGEQ